MTDYPYIHAWGRLMGTDPYFIRETIERARNEQAPANVLYWNDLNNTWTTLDDAESVGLRSRLEELAAESTDIVDERKPAHERALAGAWATYSTIVVNTAEHFFKAVVLNWLSAKGYSFRADPYWGWIVLDGDEHVPAEYIPKHVLAVLNAEVAGMPTTDLGSLMPNYDPEG